MPRPGKRGDSQSRGSDPGRPLAERVHGARGAGGLHLALAAACWVLVGCDGSGSDPELLGEPRCDALHLKAPAARASLVLIVNDAMRRDAAGIYGGQAQTPHFDRFAREHLRFDHAVAQSPWTKPSIATLFTSLHPSQHGVASDPQMRSDKERTGPTLEVDMLAEPFLTLAEVLREAGLRTAAFVSNPWVEGRFGFGQGFELYDDSAAAWGASGEAVVESALAWLRERRPDERFFVYLHLIDSHRPYGRIDPRDADDLRRRVNGDPYRLGVQGELIAKEVRLADGTPALEAGFRPTRALVRAAYRLGVEHFDRLLGRFLEAFRRTEAWQRTAVIVTSDHGEALFEHGFGGHGHSLYDDEAAIPLAARLPGVTPQRGSVDCLVGLVDLMPSLCTYLGVACPQPIEGWSFLSTAGSERPADRRFLVTEGVMRRPLHRSVRNRSFKLIYEPRGRRDGRRTDSPYSLFDVGADPGERFDQLDEMYRSQRSDRAFQALKRALEEAVADYEPPPRERAPVDAGLRERLEALGYLRD